MLLLRVTENVQHIVTFIEQIIRNGHAYSTSDGDVYFDIQSIMIDMENLLEQLSPKKLVVQINVTLEILLSGRSPSPKSHIGILRGAKGGQAGTSNAPLWLAQYLSEAYHQCGQWCNYFLHSGHLHLKGRAEKMSKSLKNYITIKDFLKSYSASEFRMFCLLSKYRSGIDYSDGSMQEARASLETVSTFINSAQAYMKGQLLTSPVQEALLWDKLEQTKRTVLTALADDFDTPRATSALLNLVYHGNCQLQPVSKCAGESRSPAVVGALVSYIQEVFDMLGIDTFKSTEAHAVESEHNLEAIAEQLTRFRSEVRAFALSRQNSTDKPGKSSLYPDRVPLLKACDTLRDELAALGLVIKDRGASSTWQIVQRKLNSFQSKTHKIKHTQIGL
ncbi:hypothetical protein WMY93_022721 [Mugilogobius chulae]|uniref:Probable cysteine--tRNA ligase, mitochondrial n=1 Tax=Mugilogobius chulae TaxID=88201 RepID=A0AAW0NK22_9GOBI